MEIKEEMKLFLQKAAESQELQEKMQACKSPEEAYAIASSVQDGFTFEEFTETMTKLNDVVNKELSDEDLAMAAGGSEIEDISIVTVITFSATATASAAAAAASI
jgi:predicted ribosomally synthesized peptide with nif11-like leader